ncbi:anthranilate synthase component I family protein [Effusibacillus consociatus]
MIKPGRMQVAHLLNQYTYVPIWAKISKCTLTPWDIYRRIPEFSHRFLLESGKVGRYSFVGGDPRAVLQYDSDSSRGFTKSLPLEKLRSWMASRRSPRNEELRGPSGQPGDEAEDSELPPFLCGMVGFVSYDLGRTIERLPEIAEDDLQTPVLYMIEPSWLIVKDHFTDDLYLAVSVTDPAEYGNAKQQIEDMERWIQEEGEKRARVSGKVDAAAAVRGLETYECSDEEREWSLTKEQFESAVERIKEYIRAGDVFQVNLSLRESRPVRVSPQAVYEKLREINPSPYMGLLEFPELSLVSCSPELLVRLRGDLAETRPIAGTRKRSGDREHDLRMVKELIENEKELAEHVMLVDLERNDLGRVCEYGSVKVDEMMTIEEYSHVMHIVSHVNGILRKDLDAVDLLAAAFPGGTITGAPKIRTMEIIEELEPVRRGIYTGSFGWWAFNGDMELNIAIRTMLIQDGKAYVQAGAGVVIDSVPEREYYESLRKAEALWQAFELAHQSTGVPS